MSRSLQLVLIGLVVAGCINASALTGDVRFGNGVLHPLPLEKTPEVKTAANVAKATVLEHERATGWPDGDIDWQDGGCVVVGLFEPLPMSMAPDPGPPYPVYLVRLADAASARETWVMVDARTGEIGASVDGAALVCPGGGAG